MHKGDPSPEDDRAFAAVARLSALNLAMYRSFMQPWVRAFASQPAADLSDALNPLRLSYTIFADSNPWMNGVQKLAAEVTANRTPVPADNPWLALQVQVSKQITAALDAYRVARDHSAEQAFFAFYGSPFVQTLLGISADSEVRPRPSTSPEKLAARRALAETYAAKLRTGGFNEALTRAVLYIVGADRSFDQRSAFALNTARQALMRLSLAEFKALVRDQFFVLQFDRERAVQAIATMVPQEDLRVELVNQATAIVSAGRPLGSRVGAAAKRMGPVGAQCCAETRPFARVPAAVFGKPVSRGASAAGASQPALSLPAA